MIFDAAVFLDKDGTLIRDVPYNVDPALIRLMPGAEEALARFQDAGYQLVVVSNQSGVARGYFREEDLAAVDGRLGELLGRSGVKLTGFYYCPHCPSGSVPEYSVRCSCRKPAPGLLRRAAEELSLDLGRSWMIGDILDDVEAGNRAGCRTVLLDNGHETRWELSWRRMPDTMARNLVEAADLILGAATGVQGSGLGVQDSAATFVSRLACVPSERSARAPDSPANAPYDQAVPEKQSRGNHRGSTRSAPPHPHPLSRKRRGET